MRKMGKRMWFGDEKVARQAGLPVLI